MTGQFKIPAPGSRAPTAFVRTKIKRFLRDEHGGLIIFSLYIFMTMFIVGGLAIDFMRLEMDRTRLQNTLDRAILAAADLDQTLVPKSVVEDYFEKAGLSEYLVSVEVDDGLNFRTVSATARIDIDTMFLKLLGINSLNAPATGTAEERISNLEVSLVLDVSGSMGEKDSTGYTTKLAALKIAASEFIDTLIEQSEPDTTSFSIVPYATQVTAGASLLSYYNVTDEHTYSNCVDFKPADYETAALSTLDSIQRAGHFDPNTGYNSNGGKAKNSAFICKTESHREILPWTDNATKLKNHINSFSSGGWTSIDAGVKWGAALLDASAQSAVQGMVEDGLVSASFSDRPYNYSFTGGMKVLIVMTDGINTSRWNLRDNYINGYSDVFVNDVSGDRSILFDQGTEDTDDDEYYWFYDDNMHTLPYGDGATITTVEYENVQVCRVKRNGTRRCKYQYQPVEVETAVEGEAIRQTFPELWNEWSIDGNAYYNYYAMNYDADDYYDWNDEPYEKVSASTMDSQLSSVCTAAKNNGILIFTIGFEVTNSSAAVMQSCASSDSHFFRVEGLEISDAFAAIASSINQLKLTQ